MIENNNTANLKVVPTEDEKLWIKLLSTGESANVIADQIGLNKNTFAYHLRFMRAKFQCKNTNQLISYFLRNKFID
jgi:DNA-binding CsgD family transcriptional regulator